MTNNFIGKHVLIKTESGEFSGRLIAYNEENGKILLEDSYNITNELDILNVLEVQLTDNNTADTHNIVCEKDNMVNNTENIVISKDTFITMNQNTISYLNEETMHELFNDAFNIYGPFEDNFCATITMGLKKFIKDPFSAKIKIVVGSDDIFGRIGLCFARSLIGRVESLDVEIRCTIKDLKTFKYLNSYKNSSGVFTNECPPFRTNYTMVLFATNRHCNFELHNAVSDYIILLDIPKVVNFPFTGLGLGFKPENYRTCSRFYYLLDVGFPSVLCKKYFIPSYFKNSLVKELIS